MRCIKKLILPLLAVFICIFLTACSRPADAPTQSADAAPAEEEAAADAAPRCTLTIRCDTILAHMEDLTRGKEGLIPADGLLYAAEDLAFEEGETVFDVLLRAMQAEKLHLEFSESPVYGSVYVEGICNLYEVDCGPLSGWIYRVNGDTPGYGCSKYVLSDGDVIEWLYTCDLGNDLEEG